MKVSPVRKVCYQEGLRKDDGQGVRIFTREVKDKVRMDFRSKEIL